MAHGFSATIDGMVADQYAKVFAEAGLGVLLFDHRNFGRSDGEPRQQADRWLQILGYRDAITFVASLPDVEASRIAVWGDSFSGGCAIVVAALDRRVAALVVQVPACGASEAPPDQDESLARSMAATYRSGGTLPPPPRVEGPMPVVSPDQLGSPSALQPMTAFRWFVQYGGLFGTGWRNEVRVADRLDRLQHHPALVARWVRAASLFVIATNDEMLGANPSISRGVHDLVGGPKRLLEVDGGHFGLLYHPSPLFDVASGVERAFLVESLTACHSEPLVRPELARGREGVGRGVEGPAPRHQATTDAELRVVRPAG